MGMFQAKGFRWWGDASPVATRLDGHGTSPTTDAHPFSSDMPIWVIYASETGAAEDFAHDACRRLKKMGRSSRLIPLEAVDLPRLATVDQALFLASTCGDGEPPFMADAFEQQYMQHPASLQKLHYGLLALGDRRYDDFCAFGRQLHQWLRLSGAHPLFEPVEMDDEEASAMRQWHHAMSVLATHAGADTGAIS